MTDTGRRYTLCLGYECKFTLLLKDGVAVKTAGVLLAILRVAVKRSRPFFICGVMERVHGMLRLQLLGE